MVKCECSRALNASYTFQPLMSFWYGRIKRVPESLACVWTPPPLRKSGIFFERGGSVYTKDTESLTLELCVLVKSGEMELFENDPLRYNNGVC